MILFLLSLMSCHKPLTHLGAKQYFSNQNCAETLKYHFDLVGCKDIIAEQENQFQWLVRCQKPDHERGDFWDNYIFRFSPSVAIYDPDDLKVVEAHTICIDDKVRIEAYKP